MSDFPTPRYRIGDVVYFPTIDRTIETLPCPDCLGVKKWRAVSPVGEEHEVACPRCTDRYASSGSDKLPSLTVTRFVPIVGRRTIRSVTVKSHPYSGNDHVEYMANETGVGSGSIYRESRLFATEAEALAVAEADAAARNAEVDALPEVTRARRFAGLTYTTAAIAALRDGIFRSWETFRGLRYAIEGHLPEDESKDNDLEREIREDVDRYGRYAGTYLPIERHPIDALIEAFGKLDAVPVDGFSDKWAVSNAMNVAIAELKRLAGFADKPEDPPCTCEHVGCYSWKPDCPRHGSKDAI